MCALNTAKSAILTVTSEHVDRLFGKWTNMFDENYCMELYHRLNERVENFYNDLLKESNEKEKIIKESIFDLRNEAAEIRRLLHKNIIIGEKPEGMPLDVWLQTLDEKITDLREELRHRRAEICELLLQQDQLCEELAELPLPLLADPLPNPEEMSTFCKHLDQLRAERIRRMDELFQLRNQIKHDMQLLQITTTSAAEEHLLSQANQDLTPQTFEKLRFMQNEYAEQVEELRRRINEMRDKIFVLWERLHESDKSIMRRVEEAEECNQSTLDILSAELQRCQALRIKNLKTIIEQLRGEIKKWWVLTLKSEQEQKRFINFNNEFYNEDLLELHELELDDLKSHYNNNREIFELFASRSDYWARMEALEAKANDPNRFNNRGGQLLKQERERNAIRNKLPKIEQQITELVKAYELRNAFPFLVHGENILERMANDWETLRQAKELQSSARKQGAATPATNIKMPGKSLRNMSAISSSTMSLRKTPSKIQMPSRINSAVKTTGNLPKRKLNTSRNGQTNAKRNLMQSLNCSKTTPVPGKQHLKPHVKKVLVLENTTRRSSGLGRRSKGHTAKLPKPSIHVYPPTTESETDETYNTFRKSIEYTAHSSSRPR